MWSASVRIRHVHIEFVLLSQDSSSEAEDLVAVQVTVHCGAQFWRTRKPFAKEAGLFDFLSARRGPGSESLGGFSGSLSSRRLASAAWQRCTKWTTCECNPKHVTGLPKNLTMQRGEAELQHASRNQLVTRGQSAFTSDTSPKGPPWTPNHSRHSRSKDL